VTAPSLSVPAQTYGFSEAKCSSAGPGLVAIGWGVRAVGADVYLINAYPTDGAATGNRGTGAYGALVVNVGAGSQTFYLYAICVSASSVDVSRF
jgi:hypothetical protein